MTVPSPPPDQDLQMRLRALSASLSGRGVSVIHHDAANRFDLAEHLPAFWPEGPTLGETVDAVLPAPLWSDYQGAMERCRATQTSQAIEFELMGGLRRRNFSASFSPDGPGIIVVLADVTEQRSREAAVAELLREVSHRSKNLLAIVQSVAMQTAHHSLSIRDFLDKFRGRLHALSSTQDLVTESDWRGTNLQSLATAQLSRIGPTNLANIRITGENPLLGPNAALHIGLAIHELAANASLHGALSEGQAGHIWLDAHYEPDSTDGVNLIIEWQESGVRRSANPQVPRFGTLVLERIVPLSVGGSAVFTLAPDHVSYRLMVPPDQFEA